MQKTFVSLDRHTVCTGVYDEPDRYRDLLAIGHQEPLIPRGSGLSYVAASFGGSARSIGMRRFNRILGFNAAERWIEVETGMTLGALFEFCASHKLCLPVQPGHPQISVGGCIAGNVHGKNQYREGLFGEHVLGLQLFHPRHGLLELSPDNEPALFDLTIGGFGLTGIIVKARLSLVPLASPTVTVNHIVVDNIYQAIDQIAALRDQHDMIYAWIDLAQRHFEGRGFIVAGNESADAQRAVGANGYRAGGLDPSAERFRPPVFNDRLLPLANAWYRYTNLRRASQTVPLYDFVFPAVGKEFYFDWFGSGGFIEMQTLIPAAVMHGYAREVVRLIRKHGQPIALATIKAFEGQQRLLHYNGSGFSFTIDIGHNEKALALLSELDELNCEVGGTTAILKDSRLNAQVVKRQYRDYGQFKERLEAFDPTRACRSALSCRLEL